MSTASQPVLCLERVTKVFATAKTAVTVLREVDLVLRTGDFVTVTGPSGRTAASWRIWVMAPIGLALP